MDIEEESSFSLRVFVLYSRLNQFEYKIIEVVKRNPLAALMYRVGQESIPNFENK